MVNKKAERIWGVFLIIVSLILYVKLKPTITGFLSFILLASIAFGVFLIVSKDIKIRKRPTQRQRDSRALMGGIAGILIGGWVLFIAKDKLGFIPSFLGIILLMKGTLREVF